MKLTKTLQLAALLAAGSSSVLSAATYNLYLTGPSSWRGSTANAVANILTNPKASFSNGATIDKALQVTFTGTIGANTWNIFYSAVGSEAAVKATSQITGTLPTLPFLTLAGNTQSAVTHATAPALVTGGTKTATPVFENDTPQVTFSDQWQASSQFKGTVAGVTYATLTGPSLAGLPKTVVGVQPYKVIASATDSAGNSYLPASYSGLLTTTAGAKTATLAAPITGLKDGAELEGNPNLTIDTTILAISGTTVILSQPAKASGTAVATTFNYAGLGNISTQLAKKAFESAGGTPAKLSQFTGSNADSSVIVYAVGRNHDAGIRAGFVYETGIDNPGTKVTAIQQYYPLDADGNVIGSTGAGTSITGLELVPAEKVNGVAYTLGQSGYSTAAAIVSVFTATNNLPNSLFISYLGIPDAKSALVGNAQEVAYNGVYYSPTAIEQGQYTLWSYEHVYYQTGLASAYKTLATQIAQQTANSDAAVSGVVIDANFKASRVPITTDGAGAIVTR